MKLPICPTCSSVLTPMDTLLANLYRCEKCDAWYVKAPVTLRQYAVLCGAYGVRAETLVRTESEGK